MKRLALYTFWEHNGFVRNYVTFYLNALKNIADKVIVIVNGSLSDDGVRKLQEVQVDFFARENSGPDFSGWKAALEREGWERVRAYDELILCDSSCYGPVFPFTDVFDAMAERDCDFWGLYRHPACGGHSPAYLQSYFLVIRKKLLCSQDFFQYWQSVKPAPHWDDAHSEIHFTQHFEKKGFSSQAYVENCKSAELIENVTIPLAHKILLENRFPLIRRKSFTEDYEYFFDVGNVSQAKELLEIIKKTSFPVEYIYEDILQTMQASDIRKILHHTFVLKDEDSISQDILQNKIAIIVFSYFEDLVDEDISYMQSMPQESDAFIVVISDNLKDIWEQKKNALPNKTVCVRKQLNRGRNESAYWLTCRDVIESYDFICVAHDKKTPSSWPPIKGYHFNRHCWKNILKSPGYVRAILALMASRPEIGMFMPPALVFADWRNNTINNEWAGNECLAKNIYARLNMHIPFDEHPDAPWGTMFWLRGKAMAPFYRYDWTVQDFPEEPLRAVNGTILHALERMYPMIMQEAGYFSAWVMPSSEADIHLDNIYHLAKYYGLILNGENIKNVNSRHVKNILKSYIIRKLNNVANKLSITKNLNFNGIW
ncbi:MAG: hypothetical protein J1E80_04230 [Desulfovibrionaceae bacterium]|nr:hypothetical protein [Desulfovibrionaceae bacterium]